MANGNFLITLMDDLGRTLAKTDSSSFWEAIATGFEKVISGVESAAVALKSKKPKGSGGGSETKVDVGYVAETELAQIGHATVEIPQNFAGLEAEMVPVRLMDQLFEITEVVENDEYVEVTALHIFYRQRSNPTLWEPLENVEYTGAAACREVLTNAMFDSGFLVASDCNDYISGKELDVARKNIVEAFLDPESGICAKYDLSLIRNNCFFYCLKEVGYDRGFVVEDGKNLLGVERTENIENVVTRIAPVGRDEEGEYVWLNYNGSKYIDSTHINDYATPRAEIYDTGLRIGEDDITEDNIQAALLEAAQDRFANDEVDVPEVTMTITFLSLGDTEEYAQYRDLDKVYLFDIIHIKDSKRGYDYSAEVIAVEHNILTGMLESVTIGTPKKNTGNTKVSTWQVPEVSGEKVRHGTIPVGAFSKGAVTSNAVADGAIEIDKLAAETKSYIESSGGSVAVGKLQESIAIVSNGNTHIAIAAGQYIYIKNHQTLDDGLYTANSAISANATLSSSNVTAVSGGGLNALTDSLTDSLNKIIRIENLTRGSLKTYTVSNTARFTIQFSSGYSSNCGMASFSYYGQGVCDGAVWFKQATGITVDVSTANQLKITPSQNTGVAITIIRGTVT